MRGFEERMVEIGLMILVYDTETTGLPRDWNAPLTDGENWPRLVQLAWQLHTPDGKLVSRGNRIVRPDGGGGGRTGLDGGGAGPERHPRSRGFPSRIMDLVLARMGILEEIRT